MEKEMQQLAENELVKELLDLLKENKTPGAEEFTQLIGYVGVMEERLSEAVEELKSVRQELQKTQDHSLKTALGKCCKAMEENLSTMRKQLSDLKDWIVEGCRNVLDDFQQRGAVALNGITRFLHLKPALDQISRAAKRGIQASDRAISQIDTFSKEFHEAGRHLKNMGRSIRGKDLAEQPKENGKIAGAIKTVIKAEKFCISAVLEGAEKATGSLEKLEKTAERPSVLKAMREHSPQETKKREKPVPVQGKESR